MKNADKNKKSEDIVPGTQDERDSAVTGRRDFLKLGFLAAGLSVAGTGLQSQKRKLRILNEERLRDMIDLYL